LCPFSPKAGQKEAASKPHVSTQILVVDDEQPVAFMLKAAFESNGYSVVSAARTSICKR
jgi:ActR/RegA family two-component response regulator